MKRLVLVFFAIPILTAFAAPSLTVIFPRGAAQGETAEVRFVGTQLGEPTDLLFYDEGIELIEFVDLDETKTTYERADGREVGLKSTIAALARLKIADDCRLGEHKLRILTAQGASQLRTFWVGAYPSLDETEGGYPRKNHEPASAVDIPSLPVTVNGRLWRNDIDCFRFEGKKGQPITIEIEGERLANHPANGITDTFLELRKLPDSAESEDGDIPAEGLPIARATDSHMFLADPVLRATLPEDGSYLITLATEVPGGDALANYYRMHVGSFERAVPYPVGGKKAPPPRKGLTEPPTPNPFRVSNLPNVLESEPNNEVAEATVAKAGQFPLALNGRIDESGDIDVFRFTVPPGLGDHKVTLYAQSIGSPLDATMELWKIEPIKKSDKTKRKRVATSTDATATHRDMARLSNRSRDLLDPVIALHAPKSGCDYEIVVKSAHPRGGPEFVYRVEVTPVVHGYQFTVPQYGNNAAAQVRNKVQLPSGGAYPTWLSFQRRFGSQKFKGRARVEALGLPKGVRFEAPMVDDATDRFAVRFECDKKVKPGGHLVQFKLVPEDPQEDGRAWTTTFQQAYPFYTRQNNYAQYHTFTHDLALIITKPAPFSLEVDPPDAALVQNGEYKIPFTVHRDKGFDGTVEVTMEMVPANVNKSTPVKMRDGETKGEFVLSASSRTEAKSYEVMLTAVYNERANRNARYGAGDYVLASEMFEIHVGKPYVVAKLARAAVERGKTAKVTAKLTHQRPIKGTAKATLKGLPRGVELIEETVSFGAKDETITFEVRATSAALFGMNRGLHCIFEIEEKDRPRTPTDIEFEMIPRLLCFLFLLGTLAGSVCAAPERPVELRLLPSQATLDGALAKQALVVQAVYADGRTDDVTTKAKLSFAKKSVARLDGRHLRPAGNGTTTLKAAFAGQKAASEITVKRAKEKRELSYRLDVAPVFMRAGCNTGACHGSARGQDGFMISLFGYDPAGDYHRLTRELVGRRIDVAVPEKSLLLEKATGAVTHTGGDLFDADSEYYATLRNWIAAGAKDDAAETAEAVSIELLPAKIIFSEAPGAKDPMHNTVVLANYSDGSQRDITHLAVYLSNNESTAAIDEHGTVTAGKSGSAYIFARFDKFTVGSEVIVLPNNAEYKWPNPEAVNFIDKAVFDKLEKLQIAPSDLCTDEEFLRRVSLDLVGSVPTAEDYEAFMADRSPDKRTALIDRLLEEEAFADLWSMKWGEMLQIAVGRQQGNSSRTPKAVYNYSRWVAERVAANAPADEMVHALVTGSGSNLHTPASNYYTSSERIDAKKRAENFAQQFLGTRIQCAQCHNHPFDRWTMDDYYGFTSFFEGIALKSGADAREFYVSYNARMQSSEHPVGKRKMSPKFLGGEAPDTAGKDPRTALADWIVSSDAFSQSMANRVWAHFFGRGVVEPVDDIRISNPPSNKELFEALGQKLADYDFDMKKLIRDICLSRTYQLSSKTNASNYLDDSQFSHAAVRRLQAEILADSLHTVTGITPNYSGGRPGERATQMYQGGGRDTFLKTFGTSTRASVCDCEVNKEATLSQALTLINGSIIDSRIRGSQIANGMLKAKKSPAEIVEALYIRTLTRKPTAKESKRMLELIGEDTASRYAYDDVLWSLLNSTEFSFNH